MRIDILTLFPEMITGAMSHSMMNRAQKDRILELVVTNPRDFAEDKHRRVDDTSYGGGPGMVMMAPPIDRAIQSLGLQDGTPIILTDPAGIPLRQHHVRELSLFPRIAIICGHYEGTDERIREKICTHCYSVGDFVVTGGELPALMMADAVTRLLPGVLNDPQSHLDDSFESGLLGHPLYTKPLDFDGEMVPEVLLSGNHKEIEKWKRQKSLQRTRQFRPDLFLGAKLLPEDVDLLR